MRLPVQQVSQHDSHHLGAYQRGTYQRGAYLIALRFFIPMLLLLICIGVLLFLRWDSGRQEHAHVEFDARESLSVLCANLQTDLEYFLRENAGQRVRAEFSALSAMPDVTQAMLVDEHGKIIGAARLSQIGHALETEMQGSPYMGELLRMRQTGWAGMAGMTRVAADRKAVLALYPIQLDISGNRLRPEKTGMLFILKDITPDLQAKHVESMAWLTRTAVLMCGLALAVGLILHFLVSRRIGKLVLAAKRVSAGDLHVTTDLAGTDEIAGLGASFDAMVRSLAESSEQVRKLSRAAAQAPVSIIITDKQGVVEFVNPRFEVVTGYDAIEVHGKPISILKSGHTPDQDYVDMWTAITVGKTWSGEILNRRKDGSLYWEQISIGPVLDEHGGISHFLSVQEDISVRKEAEANLKLFARIFDSVHEGIMVTDADQNIVFTNPAFTGITGYEAAEVAGQNPRILGSGLMTDAFYEDMWRSINKTGSWQGEVIDRRKDGESYVEWLSISALRDDDGKVSQYIAVFSDISDRKEVENKMAYMAQHDFLTGLPNRMMFLDRLTQAIAHAARERRKVAVLFLDLDRFKRINDTLGHFIGDKLLQEVALRIGHVGRASDTVSRQGGDEFVVMLPDLETVDDVAPLADKLLEAVAGQYHIDGHDIEVTTSIGISIFPEDGADNGALLKHADVAMYHAKESGRNNYQFFTHGMNQRALERMAIEKSLRRALEQGEFFLQYQPQVDLHSGSIIGTEALLRWNDPETGLIPPARFIPIAEENGMIIPIGEWVLREACRQNAAWRSMGLPHIVMSVNLSAVQFRSSNLGETIMRILHQSGLEASGLELEITEGVIMQSADTTVALLNMLKEQGLKLTIDDFGTGYSSLSYLKRFPIDRLKIDQSFVRDITTDSDDAAIVSTIISMARNLKMNVIAEGVETAEQLDFLRQHGCDEMQGYYFSRPVDADKIAALLVPSGNLFGA